VHQILDVHLVRLGHRILVGHLDRLVHPRRQGRCALDAWDAARPEAAEYANPEHPVPAAAAAQR
jgi:hypothetical protein